METFRGLDMTNSPEGSPACCGWCGSAGCRRSPACCNWKPGRLARQRWAGYKGRRQGVAGSPQDRLVLAAPPHPIASPSKGSAHAWGMVDALPSKGLGKICDGIRGDLPPCAARWSSQQHACTQMQHVRNEDAGRSACSHGIMRTRTEITGA